MVEDVKVLSSMYSRYCTYSVPRVQSHVFGSWRHIIVDHVWTGTRAE